MCGGQDQGNTVTIEALAFGYPGQVRLFDGLEQPLSGRIPVAGIDPSGPGGDRSCPGGGNGRAILGPASPVGQSA